MAQEETYQITEQEMLTYKLLQSELEKVVTQAQLFRERLAHFQRELAGKYSEYGKYELLGELDDKTRIGKRRLVKVEEVEVEVSED